MDIFQAIILGIVQGVTEWLPISSKSHLIIVQQLFGLVQPAIFDLILHIGSLIVILVVFWKDIFKLIKGVINRDKNSIKYVLFLMIASIPIAIIGFIFSDFIKSTLSNMYVLGFGFLFTALILLLSKYPIIKPKNPKLKLWNIIVIGIFQVAALFPGVSRSGTTISTGMIVGVNKKDVAKFSFLMFIPAILGATLLEISEIGSIDNIFALIIGTIVAMITGYITLKLLMNIIEKNKFWYFSIYCFILGIIVLLFAYKII
ncbi:MAG: undecaprenyl-diphosphate phosphatase, partial [Candidatus Woesearchaeota archaeon]